MKTKKQDTRASRRAYYGYFHANGGNTYNAEGYAFTSKEKALKTMRKIATGNMFAGGGCVWRVDDADGETVHEGEYIHGVGIRYRIKNYVYNY